MTAKPVLAGLSLGELKDLLIPYPALRSRQIYEWICRGIGTFNEMTNLPLSLRKELHENYALYSGEPDSELKDRDGTVKLGIRLEDGARIEAVMLQDGKERKTACLSSQAGCPAGCVFCKTGLLGFKRNLTAQEIAAQFLHLKRREGEISHIVVMGMGEPLFNLDELRKALDFFTDPGGLNISKRRITLSTSGIVKGILDLADAGPDLRLALSLITARQELRDGLMPIISRENPLAQIKEALLKYQEKKERRITLEMVLLAGLNTSAQEAKAAADFAGGLNAVFNLIPWNHVPGMEFEGLQLKRPEKKEVAAFAAKLESFGLKVTQRREKGRSISGACGQLGAQ
jgi:23S rRNA (adenine2503-C2)-methyltransferase